MIAVIQRVSRASVTIDNKAHSSIRQGLLVLLGIDKADQSEDADWLSRKVVNMRLFPDERGVMNKSILDLKSEILVVSQFTLHASTKKGNRPSYAKAAKPEIAIPIYESFVKALDILMPTELKTGVFGADMKVELINDGPVTIIVDTKNKF